MHPTLSETIRYWERRRLTYNLVLSTVVVAWIALTWPHFRPALTLTSLGIMLVLALLANVCYSAVYLVDIPLQRFSSDMARKNGRWRSALWLAGTIFAVIFENYWIADEIYPSVR